VKEESSAQPSHDARRTHAGLRLMQLEKGEDTSGAAVSGARPRKAVNV